MNIIWYIFIPGVIGIPVFTYAFFKYPRYAIAGLIIAKPIIDLTWDYHILLNINFLKLYAGLFVILGVIYIIVKKIPVLSFKSPLSSFPISNASFPRRRESSNCHPEPLPELQNNHPESVPESPYSSDSRSIPSRAEARDHFQTKALFQRSSFPRFSVSPFHFLSILWLIFLGLNFISIFIISDAFMLIHKMKCFLSVLTGFTALVLFAHLFDYEKDKKFVLNIFIIAGIFPILLWLIPVLSGNPIISNDPLRRIMGPYQNFWNFNFHATQTLICCLAYLSFSQLRNFSSSQPHLLSSSQPLKFIASKLRLIPASQRNSSDTPSLHFSDTSKHRLSISPFRMMAFIMLIVSVAMIYKCYSKAGWITLVVCLFGWFLLRRKYILAGLISVITAIIIFVNPFAADFQKTFSNEINYVTHADNTGERVFRGRLSRWGTGMQRFIELPVINKLFGAKKSIGDPENDYFRILWYNGVAGLSTYIVLLLLTGYFLLNGYVVNKQPVVLVGVLAFVGLIISSMGSYALYYPSQQWFMWGMVGFVISKQRTKSMG